MRPPQPVHSAKRTRNPSVAAQGRKKRLQLGELVLFAKLSDMPTSDEEMGKTLSSRLMEGAKVIIFDNINSGIDSGTLANAMTAGKFNARVLGQSQTMTADVRCAWLFAGNNIECSPEMLRRLVPIDLDARMADPTTRTEWRHDDLLNWIGRNRGRLVWACLTLTQRWIADGCPRYSGTPLASYEGCTRVIGGILETAGIKGFLGNLDTVRESLGEANEDATFVELLEHCIAAEGKPTAGKALTLDFMSVKQIAEIADAQEMLLDARRENIGGGWQYSAQSLGMYLGRFKNRVFAIGEAAWRFTSRKSGKSRGWALEGVLGQP